MGKKKPYYDTGNALRFIKKKYPLIPMFVISRVMLANDLYMRSVGIIDFKPTLDWWSYKNYKK